MVAVTLFREQFRRLSTDGSTGRLASRMYVAEMQQRAELALNAFCRCFYRRLSLYCEYATRCSKGNIKGLLCTYFLSPRKDVIIRPPFSHRFCSSCRRPSECSPPPFLRFCYWFISLVSAQHVEICRQRILTGMRHR